MFVHVVNTVAETRQHVSAVRAAGKSVGFVPTMGALHQGHARLIETAHRECDDVIVSIFVNPLQFGPTEDFSRYPRTLSADVDICNRYGASLIFAPSVQGMYPVEQVTSIEIC